MRTIAEVNDEIDQVERRLLALNEEHDGIVLAGSKFTIGQIISFGRDKTEGKVVRLRIFRDDTMPIVVMKTKSGQWGAREKTLYSWDLTP